MRAVLGARGQKQPPPPNPQILALIAQQEPATPQPPAPSSPTNQQQFDVCLGFSFFGFLIEFKHNKLLIEGGGGGWGAPPAQYGGSGAQRPGQQPEDGAAAVWGGLKITKEMGDVKGKGGGEEEHRLLAPSKVQDLCLGAAIKAAQRLLLCLALGAAHSLRGSEAVRGSGVSRPLPWGAGHVLV